MKAVYFCVDVQWKTKKVQDGTRTITSRRTAGSEDAQENGYRGGSNGGGGSRTVPKYKTYIVYKVTEGTFNAFDTLSAGRLSRLMDIFNQGLKKDNKQFEEEKDALGYAQTNIKKLGDKNDGPHGTQPLVFKVLVMDKAELAASAVVQQTVSDAEVKQEDGYDIVDIEEIFIVDSQGKKETCPVFNIENSPSYKISVSEQITRQNLQDVCREFLDGKKFSNAYEKDSITNLKAALDDTAKNFKAIAGRAKEILVEITRQIRSKKHVKGEFYGLVRHVFDETYKFVPKAELSKTVSNSASSSATESARAPESASEAVVLVGGPKVEHSTVEGADGTSTPVASSPTPVL